MSLSIRWEPRDVPEERKKPSWEGIIRTAVGEPVDVLEVRLRLSRRRSCWRVAARVLENRGSATPHSTADSHAGEFYTARIVDALRSAGMPVE
jgi:hypothetical protein